MSPSLADDPSWPFRGLSAAAHLTMLASASSPVVVRAALGLGRLRLAIPEWCEPDWRALMESCWVSAAERPLSVCFLMGLASLRQALSPALPGLSSGFAPSRRGRQPGGKIC